MNDKFPIISIIVPVYNVDHYLNKCVESLVLQTYQNIQIILVDDGSTDDSPRICDQWKKKDERIEVIHKKNGGLSDARNTGIQVAIGSYLAFVDGDDFLSVDAIEIMIKDIQESGADIAVCNMVHIDQNNNTNVFYAPCHEERLLCGLDRFQTLSQPSVCNKVFCATLFENIYFPLGKYYEDTFIYHILAYRAKSIVLTGSDSYWYLIRESSILGTLPQYTVKYFDFIEAIWHRTIFLLQYNIQPYADQACLSLYAALSNAEMNIKRAPENLRYFKKARYWYETAYKQLMRKKSGISIKQRIRLILLKFCPKIHSKVYRLFK